MGELMGELLEEPDGFHQPENLTCTMSPLFHKYLKPETEGGPARGYDDDRPAESSQAARDHARDHDDDRPAESSQAGSLSPLFPEVRHHVLHMCSSFATVA